MDKAFLVILGNCAYKAHKLSIFLFLLFSFFSLSYPLHLTRNIEWLIVGSLAVGPVLRILSFIYCSWNQKSQVILALSVASCILLIIRLIK